MFLPFVEALPHGTLLGVVGAALVFGAAAFKFLSDKRADRLVRDKVAELEAEKKQLTQEKSQVGSVTTELEARAQTLSLREESVGKLRSAILGSEEELWRMYPPVTPEGFSRIMVEMNPPVFIVANLKGGVSKTTICSNLAAHYGRRLSKRVLVVDLDHQGSLSNLLLSSKGDTEVRSDINRILDPYFDLNNWHSVIKSLDSVLKNVDLISASHALAPIENKIMLDYLLQEAGQDRRYLLARFLQSRAVRETYGLIILDSPPRLTAAAINGLCAATHVLVPTVLDTMSAEAVGFFLASAKRLRSDLNPYLNLLGVVGVMTDISTKLQPREMDAVIVAEKQISQSWPSGGKVLARNIPHRAAIQARKEGGIAYDHDPMVRKWFDELGQDLSSGLRLNVIGANEDERIAATISPSDIPRSIIEAFTRH
jgi:cellulose biosynthesis protein BcsQ